MNRLKHITFTGVDAKTDIKKLKEIQQRWPQAEFGVLTSYHWYNNGNRYLDPRMIRNLTKANLNLSLHLCGEAAHNAACNKWGEIELLSWGQYRWFKRIQLNLANREDNPDKVHWSYWYHEIIVQQKDIDRLDLYKNSEDYNGEGWPYYCGNLSVLLDASGGQGIDAGIKILKTDGKVGYAGGFNPDNVEEKLTFLLDNVKQGEFWIDMESGVRTNDWFDLNKVAKVLEACDNVLKRRK